MGESKRRRLSGAIERAVEVAAPDKEEMQRREKIKAELRRLIDVVDAGKFEAMISVERPADRDFDESGRAVMVNSLVGELHVLQATAANVVLHFKEQRDKQAGRASKKNPHLRIIG